MCPWRDGMNPETCPTQSLRLSDFTRLGRREHGVDGAGINRSGFEDCRRAAEMYPETETHAGMVYLDDNADG